MADRDVAPRGCRDAQAGTSAHGAPSSGQRVATSAWTSASSRVREALKPGTSALFLVVEKAMPDKAIAALGKFGGRVMRTSLSEEDTAKLQDALSAEQPVGAGA